MSRYLSFTSVLLFSVFLYSCQKELSFEQGKPSRGSLQSASGNCLPKTVGGTYKAGEALGDSNFIDVTIDVTQTGNYTVYTDTINGYYFRATGKFATTGPDTIRLKGFGTPGTAGSNTFAVYYDSSICNVTVTVVSGSGGSGGTSVFTLSGSGGNCLNSSVQGTYTQGTALDASNKVNVEVNVTTPGTWTLSTSTVSGFSFSGSGTFTTTGVQTITLNGTGTPTTAGQQTFALTAASTACSFAVTVNGGTPPSPNTDHLPLTPNTYWTYNDAFTPGDTIKRVNNNSTTIGGNVYRVIEEFANDGTSNGSFFYRKTGNDYFEYTEVHNYAFLTFDSTVEGDILFLKEGLATNNTWMSAEYSGTEGGINKKLRYVFTCTDANANGIVINGKTYNNVYKITFKPQVSTSGGPFADEGLVWEVFYAQGVGMIYMKGSLGSQSFEWNLRYYQVF